MGFRDRGKTPYDNQYGPDQHSEVRILIPINKLWSFFTKKKKKEDTQKVSVEAPASTKRTGNNDDSTM